LFVTLICVLNAVGFEMQLSFVFIFGIQ